MIQCILWYNWKLGVAHRLYIAHYNRERHTTKLIMKIRKKFKHDKNILTLYKSYSFS